MKLKNTYDSLDELSSFIIKKNSNNAHRSYLKVLFFRNLRKLIDLLLVVRLDISLC